MRCQIDKQAHVLIYTWRAIKKGEILRMDYNEGGYDNYDTSQFD